MPRAAFSNGSAFLPKKGFRPGIFIDRMNLTETTEDVNRDRDEGIIQLMKDMLGRDNVVTAEEALRLLLDNIPRTSLGEETIALEDALARVCSRDIVSPEDLPPFPRSTVDGFAVKAEDTFGATETMPSYLNVSQEIFMGERPAFSLSKGTVARIPTGGILPAGADAAVMHEHVQPVDAAMIEVLVPVVPGENVIHAGEDVKRGEIVVRAGRRLRPQDIGVCAGLGLTGIAVCGRPMVSILSTGDEIVPAREIPEAGQVRDINSYVLSGMITNAGCVPVKKGIFRDDYEEIRSAIEASMKDSAAILVSGGTSVGTKDMVARIITDIGKPGLLFHGVSLKPGKPMMAGVVDGVPVFGLPGHPAAVGICFDIFVGPVLERLSGLGEPLRDRRRTVRARLSRNVSSPQGREEHVRVMLEERAEGLWAVPVPGKSGLITTLVKADGTFVIPLNRNGVEKGELIEVRLF
jgi:molybdopterin molybdotransferase